VDVLPVAVHTPVAGSYTSALAKPQYAVWENPTMLTLHVDQ